MDRLLAIILAALTSVFSGVDFVMPKEDDFFYNSTDETHYFQIANDGSEVNYKNLYGMVKGHNWSNSEACDITRRQDTERKGKWPTIHEVGSDGWADAQNIFAPVFSETTTDITVEVTDNEITWTISPEAKGDFNISAPAAGEIDTSHFACRYGTYMSYFISQMDGTEFTLVIENAKCWFCCAHKTVPEDGRYTATTNDSLKGMRMGAGDVLCIGKADTVITLTRIIS